MTPQARHAIDRLAPYYRRPWHRFIWWEHSSKMTAATLLLLVALAVWMLSGCASSLRESAEGYKNLARALHSVGCEPPRLLPQEVCEKALEDFERLDPAYAEALRHEAAAIRLWDAAQPALNRLVGIGFGWLERKVGPAASVEGGGFLRPKRSIEL